MNHAALRTPPHVLATAAGLLLLLGCFDLTPTSPKSTGPVVNEDRNAGRDMRTERAQAAAAQRESNAARAAAGEVVLLESVTLAPVELLPGMTLTAEALKTDKADSFTDVRYTWYVNDREVSGITVGTFDSRRVPLKRGDTVRVSATATDGAQRTYTVESNRVRALNTPPTIVTNVRNAAGLDMIRLKAEDPDGDAIVWSVEGGAPGVSINQDGMVRVDEVRLDAAFDGEVVFVARDPKGGRAELHVPLKINAATADSQIEKKVTKRVGAEKLTDAELDKVNEDWADRVGKMTAEEYDAYLEEVEKNKQR